jgi:hypothetical protein
VYRYVRKLIQGNLNENALEKTICEANLRVLNSIVLKCRIPYETLHKICEKCGLLKERLGRFRTILIRTFRRMVKIHWWFILLPDKRRSRELA